LLAREMVGKGHVSADSEHSGGCPTGECTY